MAETATYAASTNTSETGKVVYSKADPTKEVIEFEMPNGETRRVREDSNSYNKFVDKGYTIVQPTVSQSSVKHSGEHVNTSTGSSVPMDIIESAQSSGSGYSNQITAINNITGEQVVYEGIVIGGVTYDVNTGERIVMGGNENQSGVIDGTKNHIERDIAGGTTTVWYTPDPAPVVPNIPPVPSVPNLPSPPEQPVYESFTQPMPTFYSDLKKVHKFTYFFGVDKIEVKTLHLNLNCARITREIQIPDNEGIQIDAKSYEGNESSIEYAIIDEGKEVPILPNESLHVKNEKIFFGMPLRFEPDESQPIVIKKDGVASNLSLQAAQSSTDGLYTATYTAKSGYLYKPTSNKVKVKFTLRLYDRTYEAPYVKSLNIKVFGGKSLWQEVY